MRVTDQQIFRSTQNDVLTARNRLFEAQKKVATGRNINAPSDDPIGMKKVLGYESSLMSITQFERNINFGKSWIQTAEQSLAHADELLTEARDIAINQSSQHFDQDTRDSAIKIVEGLYDQLMDMANSRLGGSFIFAGYNNETQPFERDSDYNITYTGDDGALGLRISENSTISLNANGEEIFQIDDPGGGAPISVFDLLRDLRTALQNDDLTGIQDQIPLLGVVKDHLQDVRAENSGQHLRMGMTEAHLSKVRLNVENSLSDLQQADMASAVLELQMEQTAYEAALSAASRVFQQSLLDFLN